MRRINMILLLLVLLAIPALASAMEPVKIKMGIMPVLDTLPLQVAVKEGYFKQQGLDVELVSFNSALERDVALQAGKLDGYFGDLIAAVLLLQNGVHMPVALTSYHTTPGQPMFGIATSGDHLTATAPELKGASIGYSKATIMEFLLEAMLDKLGLPEDHFQRVEVKKVPIRMQMLVQKQLDTALLPEALLSLVKFKGGGLAYTAESLDIPLTILGLDAKFMAGDADVYKRFVAAYSMAIQALADHPEDYRVLMGETCRVPPPLLPKFPIYKYPQPELPTKEDVKMVTDWMAKKGMLKGPILYSDVVSPVAP